MDSPDDDDDFLAALLKIGDNRRPSPPTDIAAKTRRNARRLLRGEALLNAAGPHGFDRNICFDTKPRFPQLVSPIDYQDASRRDDIEARISSVPYSLSLEERDIVQERWDPFCNDLIDPEKDPDLAAYHFVNAYRACISCLFGRPPPKKWAPLSPMMASGRANPVCTKFATFLGRFCRNGFTYPHGWIFYRLNVLWKYGKLADRVRDGSAQGYLRKYGTFMHVLDGGDCAAQPKKYQAYNHHWKAHFQSVEERYSPAGEELYTLRRATVNELADQEFDCVTDIPEVLDYRAQLSLERSGYFQRRNELTGRNLSHFMNFKHETTKAVKNGKWVWTWPFNGGEVRKAVLDIKRGVA